MAKEKKGIALYRVTCTGISPMLQNPMTNETLDELLGGRAARKAPKTDLTPEQRIEPKICRGPNREYGFPVNYLFAALVGAGREVAYAGKSNISTATSTKLPGFLSIVPDLVTESGDGFIPFLDQSVKPIPDKRRGVLATGGVAVAIVRPKFLNWAFEVTIEVNEELISIDKVEQLFTVAGRSSGIGDFRPSKRGQFGCFTVDKFVALEAALDQAA